MHGLSEHCVSSEPTASLLTLTIATLVLGATATALALADQVPDARVNTLGPAMMVAVGLAAGWLVWRKQLHLATQVLVYGVCLTTTGIAAYTGGVRSPVMVVYPVAILMFGWLTNARAAVVLAMLASGLAIGLWALEKIDQLPVQVVADPSIFALHQVIVFLLAAVFVVYVLRVYQSQLRAINKMSEDLAEYANLLEQNTEQLERAQSVAQVGSWVADLTANQINPSAQGCMVLGLPPNSSLTADAYLALVHPQDRALLLEDWKRALKDGQFDSEHRLVIDGVTRWVRQRAELDLGADGRAASALGIAQDVTERKQIQLALNASETRHRTLIEWSPEAIMVHRQTRILYANPAALKLFGAPDPASLLGESTTALIHPDSLAMQTQRMMAIAQGQWVEPVAEAIFLTLDGRAVSVEVQGTAIEFDGAPAIHVLIRDITERKRLEDEIRQLAFYDTLTGLPNRRLLTDRIGQAIASQRRSGAWGALMFLDLDNFKPLNDVHGHSVGDMLLVQAAQRLCQCVRETDTVARFGGDEFVVLLVDLDHNFGQATAHAQTVADKIRASLAARYQLEAPAPEGGAQALRHICTVSIGVVVYASQGVSAQDLTKWADAAMYQAKAQGRNRVHLMPAPSSNDSLKQ